MQIQKNKSQAYKGSIDCGIQIFKKHGMKGLYLGFNITLIREVIALSQYFSLYEFFTENFSSVSGVSERNRSMMASFLAGGLAGSLSWLFSYPLDYIKSIIQSQQQE